MNRATAHRFPTAEEGDPETYEYPEGRGWVCYHCGERFTTPGSARDHFGADPDSVPGCLLKVQLGGERGMLMAMRHIEDGLQDIAFALNDENWIVDSVAPQRAVDIAWRKAHDLMEVLQRWRRE